MQGELFFEFEIPSNLVEKGTVKILGNIQQLGNWNAQQGLQLKLKTVNKLPSSVTVWDGCLQFPLDKEFKVVIERNGINWECLNTNQNRKYRLKNGPTKLVGQFGVSEMQETIIIQDTNINSQMQTQNTQELQKLSMPQILNQPQPIQMFAEVVDRQKLRDIYYNEQDEHSSSLINEQFSKMVSPSNIPQFQQSVAATDYVSPKTTVTNQRGQKNIVQSSNPIQLQQQGQLHRHTPEERSNIFGPQAQTKQMPSAQSQQNQGQSNQPVYFNANQSQSQQSQAYAYANRQFYSQQPIQMPIQQGQQGGYYVNQGFSIKPQQIPVNNNNATTRVQQLPVQQNVQNMGFPINQSQNYSPYLGSMVWRP